MGFSCGTVYASMILTHWTFKSLCLFCAGIKIISNILTCCHDDGLLKTAFIRFIVKMEGIMHFQSSKDISTGKEQTEDKIQLFHCSVFF